MLRTLRSALNLLNSYIEQELTQLDQAIKTNPNSPELETWTSKQKQLQEIQELFSEISENMKTLFTLKERLNQWVNTSSSPYGIERNAAETEIKNLHREISNFLLK